MKKSAAIVSIILLLGTSSYASLTTGLFVKADNNSLVSVEGLVQDQVDVQVDYGYESFCYAGPAAQVMAKMKAWKKSGYFFSGAGGGFVLQDLKLRRGIAVHSIVMTLEDEVVPGEFTKVIVNPCQQSRN